MITPMLLSKQMLFSEAIDIIKSSLDFLGEPVTDRHQVVLEMPQKPGEAYDEFDLLDADYDTVESNL